MIRVAVIAGLAGLLVTGSLTAVIVAKTKEEGRLRDRLEIADQAVARAAGCDAALTGGDLFAVEARCSLAVKIVVAERAARTFERDDALSLLAQVRTDQAAAIARAEARGRTQTQRTQSAQTRLDAAPRNPAGLGQCDAVCLSGLGER